jgi:hypothetical protein
MLAFKDAASLYEGRHDDLALVDLSKLTVVQALQAALTYTKGELATTRINLETAARAFARESDETAQARHGLAQAATKTEVMWRFLVSETGRSVVPDPDAPIAPDLLERRQQVISRVLPLTASEFTRLTSDRKIQVLTDTIAATESPANHEVLGDAAERIRDRLAPLLLSLRTARDTLTRELREDRDAFLALETARAEYDRAHATHQSMVEAVLRDTNRLAEIGKYIRALDPAYRARRTAGRPLREEPGIEAITAPLGVTPDAIEVPPPV